MEECLELTRYDVLTTHNTSNTLNDLLGLPLVFTPAYPRARIHVRVRLGANSTRFSLRREVAGKSRRSAVDMKSGAQRSRARRSTSKPTQQSTPASRDVIFRRALHTESFVIITITRRTVYCTYVKKTIQSNYRDSTATMHRMLPKQHKVCNYCIHCMKIEKAAGQV